MQREIRMVMLAALAASACTKGDAGKGAPPTKDAPNAPASRLEAPAYVVELTPPGAAAAGAETTAVVHVATRGKYHVNVEYPLAFLPDEADGLRFAGKRLPLGEGAEYLPCGPDEKDTCGLRAKVPFTADKPAKLSGVLAFGICEAEKCLIEKVKLAADVPVR